jgi:hypothetical protein
MVEYRIQWQALASALLNKILSCSQIIKETWHKFRNIVIWRLKTGVVEPQETYAARQILGKHSLAINMTMSPAGPRTKNDCAGEDQPQITTPEQTRVTQSWAGSRCIRWLAVSTEVEKFPLLEAATKQRLPKIQ